MSSNYQIGVWQTSNTASATTMGKKNRRTVAYSAEESESPNVPVGFKMLSMSENKANAFRIGGKAYTTDVYEDKFTMNIDSRDQTHMFNGGAMWFKYGSGDADFQTGVVKTDNGTTPNASVTKRVVFPNPYTTQPKVFVGISGMELSLEWHMQVYATDIDVNGFTLHFDPLGATNMHWAQVNWIAFSADRPDVTTGTFSSQDNGNFNGQVNLRPALSASPHIFYALSKFHSEKSQNLEIRTDVSNVSASGFNWKVTTVGSSKNYIVSGAYLAVVF
ncbi:hypothetical protein JB92DRAFT_2082451 [Gautieria morchelliformis]|nr:hypothetical protein JB92DRAFT_2082451 [Gautieria morchelliformis]